MDEAQQAEADYKKELADAGVELPKEEEPKPEIKAEETPEEPEAPQPEEPKKPNESEPKERVARQLSDKYKEKKAELRSEREQREQAEQERDELKLKLEEFQRTNSADTENDPEDVLEYAAQKGADPELVKRILDEARANQPQVDPELRSRLDQFENWQKQNAQVLEKQQFENEFAQTVPALQSMFPNANAEEISAMKSELDTLAHSKGMHDKELEYVAFKHKDRLSALVSPRQRGMESKGRNQVDDTPTEWNPNADLSKMSAKQLEAWEATYNAASERGIIGTGNNRRML